MIFSGQGERFINAPWGIFGGGSGGTGKFVKLTGDGEVPLPTKPANLAVQPDEAIMVETPGAGGYGNPAERDKAALAGDFASAKFTRGYLKAHYGFDPAKDKR
jgi:N-methylhydantoinase B